MRALLVLSGLCSLLASALACGGTERSPSAPSAPSPDAAPGSSSAAEHFLPLKADTVYSYHAWLPESAEPELLILQVERLSPRLAHLRSSSSVKRLELAPEGIRMVTGGYLLKLPLQQGAEWAGPAGRVRISAVEQEVSVTAGRFVGCLETTESDARTGTPRTITTTYCPDVGIAKFSVEAGGQQQRFELQSFGPRVDIDQL